MAENKYVEISKEKLLKETKFFKDWSGPALVKLFVSSEHGLVSLGSGGLMQYRGRYFVITNEHVVRSVAKEKRKSELIIPYKDKRHVDMKVKILHGEEDVGNDFAAFEICKSSAQLMENHWFLNESHIEQDVLDYTERSNVVFVHGFPMTETNIDSVNKSVCMTTQPYTTFVSEYHEYAGILEITAAEEGISEFGTEVGLPGFGGMSGSLVYGYYMDELTPYKVLGILTYWKKEENLLGVYPIREVIDFLDAKFFIAD